jgi:hypothetical protein
MQSYCYTWIGREQCKMLLELNHMTRIRSWSSVLAWYYMTPMKWTSISPSCSWIYIKSAPKVQTCQPMHLHCQLLHGRCTNQLTLSWHDSILNIWHLADPHYRKIWFLWYSDSFSLSCPLSKISCSLLVEDENCWRIDIWAYQYISLI